MPLWLYALTAAPLPAAPHLLGVAGEPLAAWPIPSVAAQGAGGAAARRQQDGVPPPASPPAARGAPGRAPAPGQGDAGGEQGAGPFQGPPAAATGDRGARPGAAAPAALYVVAGEVAAPPRPDEAALRAHDRAVRALAATLDPLLPIRFGQTVASPQDLLLLLSRRRPALLAALARVAGCHQLTLRFPGPAAGEAGERQMAAAARAERREERGVAAPAPGPGTRYLLARHHAATAGATAPPRARPVLARLAPHVRAERLAPARPPYAATVYHLVERCRLDAYLAALSEAATAAGEPPPTWSGPWPAWAFAPGLAD